MPLTFLRPRRLDPRRRFRDRLIAGMVVVALLPLGVFALLVAADLGGITSRTVEEAHTAIRSDLEARQQTAVADRSRLIDARLSAIAAEVRQLHDALVRSLAAPPPPPPLSGMVGVGGAEFSGSSAEAPQSLLVRAGQEKAAAPAAGAALASVSTMAAIRRVYPEVSASWVAQRSTGLLVAAPGFDVAAALSARRIGVADLRLRGSQDVLAAALSRMSQPDGSQGWTRPGVRTAPDGPYWTDAYPTMEDGTNGVTVWMPVGGDDISVGVDLSLAALAATALSPPVTTADAADTLLLSSSNMILAGSGQLQHDFNAPPDATGAFLPVTGPRGFAGTLRRLEQTGRPAVVPTSIGGRDAEFITEPVYTSQWLLATAVPTADLEPDLAALTKGVESGIGRLYLEALPVLLLLLLLAFVLATVLARRLVGPVRVLTAAAGRLARGETALPVPPQGHDEVGVLAESLEQMRQDINASRDAVLAGARELEARVAERTGELRARNEELVALNDLAGSLTRSLDPADVIGDALAAIRAIVPAADACGYLLQEGTLSPVRSQRSRPDDGLGAAAVRSAASGEMMVRDEAGAQVVAVPLATGGRRLGALALRWRAPRPDPATMRLIRGVADQAALALRTAELSAENEKTAVHSERARLAREIHDTLAQQLTAVVVQLEAAEGLVAKDAGRARRALAAAREMARSALQEARRSVWDLRPAPLTATGLVAALDAETAHWSERSGVAAAFRAEGIRQPLPLGPEAEVALLRILQEALTNAGRHSAAATITVRLRRERGRVTLSISDDGRGFDPAAPGSMDCFGLIGMAERARLVGGALRVESAPGAGTTVTVSLPLAGVEAVPA